MTIQDTAFFGTTEVLSAHEDPADTAPWAATPASPAADQSAQLKKVMEDLIAADCWESMAMRSVARSTDTPTNHGTRRPPSRRGRLDGSQRRHTQFSDAA
jgi:hypothetical protein